MKYFRLEVVSERNKKHYKPKIDLDKFYLIQKLFNNNELTKDILDNKDIIKFVKKKEIVDDFLITDYLPFFIISEKLYLHYLKLMDKSNFIEISIHKTDKFYAFIPFSIKNDNIKEYILDCLKQNKNIKDIFVVQNKIFISENFKEHFQKINIPFINFYFVFDTEKMDLPFYLLKAQNYNIDLNDHSHNFTIIKKDIKFDEGVNFIKEYSENVDILDIWKKDSYKKYALVYKHYLVHYNILLDRFEFKSQFYSGHPEQDKEIFDDKRMYAYCDDFLEKNDFLVVPDFLKKEKWNLVLQKEKSNLKLD